MTYEDQWNQNRVDWLYQLARCPDIDPPAVRVGLLFGTFLQAEAREEVHPSFQWLTENAHMSRATLSFALRQLEWAGFIEVRRNRRENNWYNLPFDGEGPWKREALDGPKPVSAWKAKKV